MKTMRNSSILISRNVFATVYIFRNTKLWLKAALGLHDEHAWPKSKLLFLSFELYLVPWEW